MSWLSGDDPYDDQVDVADLAARLRLDETEAAIAEHALRAAIDPGAAMPTVAGAVRAVAGADLTAFAADGRLRTAGIVAAGDRPLAQAPVVVDDRLVLHLAGHDGPDPRLLPYVRRLDAPAGATAPSRRTAAVAVAEQTARRPDARVDVRGPGAKDRLDVIGLAFADPEAGPTAWVTAGSSLPSSPVERDAFARLWNREVLLTGAVLVVDASESTPDEDLLARIEGPVVVSSETATGIATGAVVLVDRPTRTEQEALWAEAGAAEPAALAARFDLDHADIVAAATAPDPAEAVRLGLRHRLDRLAQRIETDAGWDDLVVGDASRRLLRHIVAAADGRRALDEAGAAGGTSRGRGITALLSGPSGTGKTLAAEVLSCELGLDLYRVDLAAAVSKWIGETEKHLRALFDAAEAGGAVLLFDEADALYGRRSEVRDSHDRYANLEVSYLLQRMEDFRGVAILTTNMRASIDPAFLRRLSVVVPFTHPTHDERIRLWRLSLPDTVAPDVDAERLAGLDLTGGQIRSIARHARLAVAATGADAPLTLTAIRDAAAAELTKSDRPLAELNMLAPDPAPAGAPS